MRNFDNLSTDTALAKALHYIDETNGAIVPAIQTSTTFARDEHYALMGSYIYSRYDNPTYTQLENVLAHLEGAADAKVFASGLAAASAVFETVDSGRHIIAPKVMYHGLQEWLNRIASKRNIGLSLVDPTEPDQVAAAMRPGETAIVWVEPLANPTWDVVDIATLAEIAHRGDAVFATDCTVCPPITTRALSLGADIVFHSATKYINGHSDVTAGFLATKHDDAMWEEIKNVRRMVGGILGPFESWLMLRGIRTLSIRFERTCANAQAIAEHLHGHPGLDAVLYPGLPSHRGHEVAARQMTRGFGGMLSLLVKGDMARTKAVVSRLRLFIRATSLGGVESLAEHRKVVEGPNSPVPDNLLRLSIGIEAAEDLIGDLEQALEI